MEIMIAIMVFVAGLVFGSFLNVCIYRIPTGETIVTGRSHCTTCAQPIKSYDLIPVISYIILKGRCRNCGERISPRYPLIELLNAVLYLGLYYFYKFTPSFIIYSFFVSALIVITFIDIDKRLIYDRLNLFIMVIGIFACFFSPDISLLDRAIGFFAASLPLFIAMIISRGGMGFGDVKLAAVAGLVLGFKLTLFSLLAACIIGSVYGIIYARAKGSTLKIAIPFGPFLSIAFAASLFCGNFVIAAYLGLFYK
jgi:leader peptidase (prepilin peptidase)/N-methyltransferase